MPFGILELKDGGPAPGTAMMTHEVSSESPDDSCSENHMDRGILRVPTPSNSPNDPLNWPLWKKDLILFIISLLSAVVGAYGPMLGPGFVEIADELGVSIDEMSQANSYLVLAIGVGQFISNPMAKYYGKRPVYLLGGLVLFASSVWGAASRGYGSFLACRLVGGLGMSPYEILVQCTIADMYFVYERATRLAFWSLFLVIGLSAGPIVSGYVIDYAGFRWTFGICAIFFGVLTLAVFFLVPETAYERNIDPASGSLNSEVQEQKTSESGSQTATNVERQDSPPDPTHTAPKTPSRLPGMQEKESYWRSLRVYTGRHSKASFMRILTRPFIIILYPAVIWGFLTWGTTITFTIAFGYVNGVIFTQPPYNMSTAQVGLTHVSPLIQSIIATFIAGPLCDWLCVYLTRRNKGCYEPEFRLALMIPGFILGVAGFYGFAATIHYKTHWTGPVITYGMVNASLSFCSTCVFGYIIDAYKNLGEEAFVAINARNFLSFGVLFFINAWLAKDGTLEVFVILGSLFVFTSILTIPLWVYGKRIRARIDRIDWLKEYMED